MARSVDSVAAGRQLLQAGDLRGAEQAARETARVDPGSADAWCLLGAACLAQERPAEAVEALRAAVRLRPDDAEALLYLGAACQGQGDLPQAEAAYRAAVSVRPGLASAHNNLGIVLAGLGRMDEAAAAFREAARLKPDYAKAWNNLGNALREVGRPAEAVPALREALRLHPVYAEAHNNLGNALRDLGRLDEAAASIREALRLRPAYAAAHNNLGVILRDQGKLEDAAAWYAEALRLQPDFAPAHNNLGVALLDRAQPAKALPYLRRAIELAPTFAEAHRHLGLAYTAEGELDTAVTAYREALRLRPGFADAQNDLGTTLLSQGLVDEALAAYREAHRLNPGYPGAWSNVLLAMNYQPSVDADALFAAHVRWGKLYGTGPAVGPDPAHDRNPTRPLRVGYVSPDFRSHAAAYFLLPVVAHHDPRSVEAFGYADVTLPDAMTERFRRAAHAWRAINGLTDAAVAELVRGDRIDILVDCAGHTAHSRLGVFARRPAPVQVTYLGYPNTTGLRAIDYRLSDAVADPPGEPTRHTEELVRLPVGFCCYMPRDEAAAAGPVPAGDRGPVTFGSLHGLAKLNDDVLALWCEVLRAVPSARLLLVRDALAGTARERLARFFNVRGQGGRVELRHSPVGDKDYLRAYAEIDVALDPFPWSGHTTACEALWMGVPVLTLRGPRFAGRMVASVLTQLDLPDLVASSAADFVARAARLAHDRAGLARLRAGLRGRMTGSPLTDGPGFTRRLETAYRRMWNRWCAGSKRAGG